MTATYATTTELCSYMGLLGEIPSLDASTPELRVKEEVGTGDDSTTIFFLDKSRILADSYTIYYGANNTTSTTLTETTHYTLDINTGQLTLTDAGVTLVGTDTIYSTYSFSIIAIKNSEYQTALDRAQSEIDKSTETHFATITDATPDWVVYTNEKQRGKGRFDKDYYIDFPPIPNVSTTLDEAVTSGDVTITVVSTNGFPSSGIIGISDSKITYTGKTATTFTGCTGVDEDIDDATYVYPYVFEASNTDQGNEPEYTVLAPGIDYDVDLTSGRVYLYNEQFLLDITTLNAAPNRLVPDRFRASYIQGMESIPADINRLCLMIAAKDLMHMAVRKAHTSGKNNFEPDLIEVDEQWIKDTVLEYQVYGSDNV